MTNQNHLHETHEALIRALAETDFSDESQIRLSLRKTLLRQLAAGNQGDVQQSAPSRPRSSFLRSRAQPSHISTGETHPMKRVEWLNLASGIFMVSVVAAFVVLVILRPPVQGTGPGSDETAEPSAAPTSEQVTATPERPTPSPVTLPVQIGPVTITSELTDAEQVVAGNQNITWGAFWAPTPSYGDPAFYAPFAEWANQMNAAGIPVLQPSYLPGGFFLTAAWDWQISGGHTAVMRYHTAGLMHNLIVEQTRFAENFAQTYRIGDAAAYEVTVRGQRGIYVEQAKLGWYPSYLSYDPQLGWIMGSTTDVQSQDGLWMLNLLIWEENGVITRMMSDSLGYDELVRIAESPSGEVDDRAMPSPTPTGTLSPDATGQGCDISRARITSPANGDSLAGIVQVIGEAAIPDFGSYTLQLTGITDSQLVWTTSSATSVPGGVLGSFNADEYPAGYYLLALSVANNDGSFVSSCEVMVVLGAPPDATPTLAPLGPTASMTLPPPTPSAIPTPSPSGTFCNMSPSDVPEADRNIYSIPSKTHSVVLDVLEIFEWIQVVGQAYVEEDNAYIWWVQVVTSDGQLGWIDPGFYGGQGDGCLQLPFVDTGLPTPTMPPTPLPT